MSIKSGPRVNRKAARLGVVLAAVVVSFAWALSEAIGGSPLEGAKFDPELRDYLKLPYVHTIVLASPNRADDVAESISGVGGRLQESLAFVNGFYAEIPGQRLKELAKRDDVAYIAYAGPAKPKKADKRFYVNVIKALEWVLSKAHDSYIRIVNLSIGPPNPKAYDPREPVNVATNLVSRKGLVTVIAAGNWGPAEGTLSSWAVPEWVISVGAASVDGKRLYGASSIGVREVPGSQPTIVAPGIDIVGPWPANLPKSPSQIEKDKQFIPPEKLDRYTVMSGTSQAAAHVTRITIWLIQFVEALREDLQYVRELGGASLPQVVPAAPRSPFSVAILDTGIDSKHEAFQNWSPAPPRARNIQRLSKLDKLLELLRSNNLSCQVEASPRIIKKMLAQMARPIPGYEPHQVGAGFVSDEVAEEYLKRFGAGSFYRLFCDSADEGKPPAFQSLGANGPLATNDEIDEMITVSGTSLRLVIAKVW